MNLSLKEVSDYFEVLSTEHLEVAHSPSTIAFCRYQDNEQFNQLRNKAAKTVVLVKSFFGGAVPGEGADGRYGATLVLSISCYAQNLSKAAIIDASEKSFGILVDYIRRMMKDYEEDPCSWVKGVDFDAIQFDEIEQPWLQNHYGWELVVPYRTWLKQYDQTKWS